MSPEDGAAIEINRRDLLFASGLFLLVATSAFGQAEPKTPQAALLAALQKIQSRRPTHHARAFKRQCHRS